MAIANERRYGTLGAVLLSPRSRTLLWLGRALPYIANGVLVTVVNLTAGNGRPLGLTDTGAGLLPALAVEAAVGLGYLLAAIFLLHHFERSSRRRATLDTL
ncbi:hypothetical protein ABZX75_06960 [Streptomyces sp. NPDC003038]|uniref:hypothetical protein n=1 Tax=unclassified Streptomyces TaxID=2593676 RepID=UPI0033A66868